MSITNILAEKYPQNINLHEIMISLDII